MDIEYRDVLYDHKITTNTWLKPLGKFGWWLRKKVDWLWWKYGYKKERIFGWCLGFVALFSIINSLIGFRWLNVKIYKIDEIYEKYKATKRTGGSKILFKTALTFFYTCMIFFGVKMSFEKVKYNHIGAVSYLYFQYLLGLLSVAYLFNFVISK